jgi:hypothetical protein
MYAISAGTPPAGAVSVEAVTTLATATGEEVGVIVADEGRG